MSVSWVGKGGGGIGMGTSKGLKSWEQHVQDEVDRRSQSLPY